MPVGQTCSVTNSRLGYFRRIGFILVVFAVIYFKSSYSQDIVFGGEDDEDSADERFGSCRTASGTRGSCLPLRQCVPFRELLRRPTPVILQLLRSSICGYAGFTPKVCCPGSTFPPELITTKPTSPTPPITNPPTPPTVEPPEPGTGVELPKRCGIGDSSNRRIVGGTPAPLYAWPWIAALGYQVRGNLRFLCGGTLVTNQHVVTAGHCVHNRNDLSVVRLGEHDFENKTETTPIQLDIIQRIIHPGFNSTTFQNDIAILKLSRPVEFSREIQPICLPSSQPINSRSFVKESPFVAGWGAIGFNGPSSATLLEAQVPVVSTEKCQTSYKPFKNNIIDSSVICAGFPRGGVDACQGDSGGPLMWPNSSEENQEFYLIGVVSFGFRCAEPEYPGVYTRVTKYTDWIISELK